MKKDYVVLNLEKEYPGYTGTEKWMIITDLDEDCLISQYPETSTYIKEAVLVSAEIGRAVFRYKANDRNHDRQKKRFLISFDELDIEKVKEPERNPEFSILHEAIDLLPEIQRNRIKAHYFDGYSIAQIAHMEGRNWNVIQKSIAQGKCNLEKHILQLKKKEDAIHA